MRLVVDLNRCQGYAQCAFLAPDVFAMHGDEALLYNPEADEKRRDDVARAVAACPVQAILVDADPADHAVANPGTDREVTGER
ncbi:ferredoxin [Streptomyces sp. NPDC048448]|uniref:Ferredoxin n=1 Tax=Streptomyces kaempferi TaxID=333725 RepID=A0ABW3XPD0_9ACTN|nr:MULTISPECIES: ferredoxin [unclassified Streptomyces]QIY64576.1 ferredoxin [Streptomyces sp. RPA4-2]